MHARRVGAGGVVLGGGGPVALQQLLHHVRVLGVRVDHADWNVEMVSVDIAAEKRPTKSNKAPSSVCRTDLTGQVNISRVPSDILKIASCRAQKSFFYFVRLPGIEKWFRF